MLKSLTASRYSYLYPAIFLAIIFFVIFSSHSIRKHQTFNSYAFDLGLFTQMIFLQGQNLFPLNSLQHTIQLSVDFAPVLIILTPLFQIFPYPETLLIIQAFFVSFSSIPIYLIARDKLNNIIAGIISLAYLLSPGLLSAINFGFHPATISVLPLSLILYFWYFKRWKLYWTTIFLSLLFKEDVTIFILGLGIFELFLKQVKIGFLTASVSLFSFYIIKFLLMPLIWPHANKLFIEALILPIDNPVNLAILLVNNPDILIKIFFDSPIKILNSVLLHQHFSYLPLLSPLNWLTVIPDLLLRYSTYGDFIGSTGLRYRGDLFWSPLWHYNANLEPFLTVSAIFALAKLRLPTYFASLLLIFFLIVNLSFYFQAVWLPLRAKDNHLTDYQHIYDSLKTIPADSAVSAQSSIVPHLANREKIYLFPEIYDSEFIVLDGRLDIWPLSIEQYQKQVNYLKSAKYWKIIKQDQSLVIFKNISY